MRIQIPLVVEMSPEQVTEWAEFNGLPHYGGPLRAKDVADDVRSYVLTTVQDSSLDGYADVSIRR